MKEKNDKLNNENKKLCKENEGLKNRINIYIKNIDEYKQINDNYQLKIEEFKQKIENLEKKNNDLIKDLDYKKRNIIDLNKDNNYLKNKYEEIKKDYYSNESNNDNIKEKINNNLKTDKNYQKKNEIKIEYIYIPNYVCKTEVKKYSKSNRIISPDNYNLIKSYSINNNLKWYLFKKKTKSNENDSSISDNKYDDYIWIPNDNIQNILEFTPIKESKSPKNNSCKTSYKENNLLSLNNNYLKLINNQGSFSDNRLNKKLIKSNIDNGFIGLSFINKDEKEISNFLDDYCFEDILNDLGDNEYNANTKNYNIYNIHNNNNKIYFNTPKKYYPNNINNYTKNVTGNIICKKENIKKIKKNNLKETIDTLLTQITPTSNAINSLTSILKQLGCLDNEIYKLIGNHNSLYKNGNDNKNK